jgi:hypothetical protein
MTDLIATLDEAASKMLEKAMASDNIADAQETFKICAAWVERRAKLLPAKPDKGGNRFNELRGQLTGTAQRATKRRGTSAEAEDEAPRADA